MPMRGIWPGRAVSCRVRREKTIWVVVVPTSMPTESKVRGSAIALLYDSERHRPISSLHQPDPIARQRHRLVDDQPSEHLAMQDSVALPYFQPCVLRKLSRSE